MAEKKKPTGPSEKPNWDPRVELEAAGAPSARVGTTGGTSAPPPPPEPGSMYVEEQDPGAVKHVKGTAELDPNAREWKLLSLKRTSRPTYFRTLLNLAKPRGFFMRGEIDEKELAGVLEDLGINTEASRKMVGDDLRAVIKPGGEKLASEPKKSFMSRMNPFG